MSDRVTCTWCGRMADDAPPTWTMQTSDRGLEWICESCTRDVLRSMEAKLPTEWW